MSFWGALVFIVAIITTAVVLITRYRAGMGDPPWLNFGVPQVDPPRDNELRREVEDLRKRIAVLERLVTDNSPSRAIADEIEGLRDR